MQTDFMDLWSYKASNCLRKLLKEYQVIKYFYNSID